MNLVTLLTGYLLTTSPLLTACVTEMHLSSNSWQWKIFNKPKYLFRFLYPVQIQSKQRPEAKYLYLEQAPFQDVWYTKINEYLITLLTYLTKLFKKFFLLFSDTVEFRKWGNPSNHNENGNQYNTNDHSSVYTFCNYLFMLISCKKGNKWLILLLPKNNNY